MSRGGRSKWYRLCVTSSPRGMATGLDLSGSHASEDLGVPWAGKIWKSLSLFTPGVMLGIHVSQHCCVAALRLGDTTEDAATWSPPSPSLPSLGAGRPGVHVADAVWQMLCRHIQSQVRGTQPRDRWTEGRGAVSSRGAGC